MHHSKQLVTGFLIEGWNVERVEFQSPSELAQLPQKLVINAPAYGARTLLKMNPSFPCAAKSPGRFRRLELNYGVIYSVRAGCRNPQRRRV